MAAKQTANSRDVSSELVYLAKALKAPTLRDAATPLAERARDEGWSHEEYLSPACSGRSPPAIRMAPRDAPGQPASPPAVTGGLRLRARAVCDTRGHRPPGDAGFRRR